MNYHETYAVINNQSSPLFVPDISSLPKKLIMFNSTHCIKQMYIDEIFIAQGYISLHGVHKKWAFLFN